MVVATQWTAEALGHQPQLGAPDAVVWGVRLYAPWKFLLWWFHYDAYAREIFETGGLIFLGGVAVRRPARPSASRSGGRAKTQLSPTLRQRALGDAA